MATIVHVRFPIPVVPKLFTLVTPALYPGFLDSIQPGVIIDSLEAKRGTIRWLCGGTVKVFSVALATMVYPTLNEDDCGVVSLKSVASGSFIENESANPSR